MNKIVFNNRVTFFHTTLINLSNEVTCRNVIV
jgi:hypothetical protein